MGEQPLKQTGSVTILFSMVNYLSKKSSFVLHSSLQGQGKEEGPVSFAALYWEEPDRTGHMYGPDNTTHIGQALKEVLYVCVTQYYIALYCAQFY
jgi:hypothetical protein